MHLLGSYHFVHVLGADTSYFLGQPGVAKKERFSVLVLKLFCILLGNSPGKLVLLISYAFDAAENSLLLAAWSSGDEVVFRMLLLLWTCLTYHRFGTIPSSPFSPLYYSAEPWPFPKGIGGWVEGKGAVFLLSLIYLKAPTKFLWRSHVFMLFIRFLQSRKAFTELRWRSG